MTFRLKDQVVVNDPGREWLVHGVEYDADWTPGWPRHPRFVRLYCPADRAAFVDLPLTAFERVS